MTVGEALAEFRNANGLDAAFASSTTWTCRLGPILLRLPNFQWRRNAILRHDLHHIMTGYPCTMRGEFQMATWEFAAGRYPHPAATLFCLPLVAAGVLWSPKAIWRAFHSGRRRRSLYETETTDAILCSPVAVLRADLPPMVSAKTRFSDILAFCFLILQANFLVISPLAVVVLGALAF